MPKKKISPSEKVRQRKLHRRLVLGPWVKSIPRQKKIQPASTGVAERRRLRKIRQQHPNWFDGKIVRVGNVRRRSTRNEKASSIPVSETTYFTRLSHVSGQKHKTRALKKLPNRFEKAPYTLGANAILELVDRKGTPSHIVIIKRPKNVEAPGSLDFVAGLIRPGKTPVSLLKTRIKKEVGIPKNKLDVIGKGFKKSKTGEALALNLNEKLLNYDTVYVIRASITPKELQQKFNAVSGKFKPANIVVIERNPKAIREFVRKNTKHILMPEVLRLYARELALHPGKGRKKKGKKVN